MAVAPDNTFTHRTSRYQSHASGLLSDSDNVYDPDIEEKSTQAVDLRTDQTELPFRLRLAQWHIDASDADVRLTVYAENGYSCHGDGVKPAVARRRQSRCQTARSHATQPHRQVRASRHVAFRNKNLQYKYVVKHILGS